MPSRAKQKTSHNGRTRTKKSSTTTQRAVRANGKSNGKLQQPKSPMPPQHQQKPGIESKLTPRPRYSAPYYRGSAKLQDKVALITGGDSGIGRAVAVLFAREGADIVITHLPEEKTDAQETQAAVEKEGRRKRPAQPEEIAPAYVYFASEIDWSYVTGEVLTLLGGETSAA